MNVAAIDIGTNSTRLLITDAGGRELERAMHITRLGQGVDVSGELHPEAITRTVAVLSRYGAEIRKHGVQSVRAVATSAARDARNSALFFEQAERAIGVAPQLLSGEEEARLSFQGATAGLAASEGPFLVMDIGGGSTEFVLGLQRPEAVMSIQVGCVRMTERHLHSDPPSPAEIAACIADVRRALEPVKARIDVSRARCVVGLAGTVTALAARVLGLDHYDASRTHHSRLTRTQVESSFSELSTVDVEARRRLLAEPKRAEVIVGGAAVLVSILREFSLSELLVSEHDILDGLAASLRQSAR